MRITALSPYRPHAAIDHAGGRHLFNWVTGLATRGHDVTVVTPDRTSAPEPPGVGVHVVRSAMPPEPLSKVSHRIRSLALLGPPAGSVAAHVDDPALRERLARTDVLEVHGTEWTPVGLSVAEYMDRRLVSAVTYEVVSERARRQARLAGSRRSRFSGSIQRRLFPPQERRLLNGCDLVVSLGPRDTLTLRSIGVRSEITEVPLLPDPVHDANGPAAEPVALFVANYARPENLEAADRLVGTIWPTVIDRVPSARLVLAGADPGGALARFASESVSSTGLLADLGPVYRAARLVIAPLTRGAGVKLKVAEAMRHGLPVVATPVAAEGYVEAGGQHAFAVISNDDRQLADVTVELLRDREAATEHGDAANRWITGAMDPDNALDALAETYGRLSKADRR